jgi:hypothetical protein
MSVPAVSSCTLTQPSFEHGALAVAKVPRLDAPGAAAEAILKKAGFTAAGANKYQAADGSWIQYSANNQRWERGVGRKVFRGIPSSLDALGSVRFTKAEHGFYAIAYLPKLVAGDAAATRAALVKAGFAATLPTFFSHPDGSFVALGDKLTVGVNDQRVTGFPAPGTAKKPKTPKSSKRYPTYTQKPSPDSWSWWASNTALGKTPLVGDDPNSRMELRKLGYVRQSGGSRGELWKHPDGSWVRLDGGASLGFQKWRLGELPYNNRRGA